MKRGADIQTDSSAMMNTKDVTMEDTGLGSQVNEHTPFDSSKTPYDSQNKDPSHDQKDEMIDISKQ